MNYRIRPVYGKMFSSEMTMAGDLLSLLPDLCLCFIVLYSSFIYRDGFNHR